MDITSAPSDARTAAPDAPLLAVRDLSVFFRLGSGETQITRDISFSVRPGERVGIVGESGCGKSVTGLSLLGLLPRNLSRTAGEVVFEGRDLLKLKPRELRRVRGRQISMIFQEPMSALDPVFTVGYQIGETIRAHFGVDKKEARERAVAALAEVGIPLPAQRHDEYPHQLSGGMRQRAMIAIALACKPKLLIADEPTTALDVTIQAQILDLLRALSEQSGTALLFITHDLGVVAETCHRMLTMYAGEIVEDAPIDDVLVRPRHPYTSGLLRSLPGLSQRKSVLPSIPGRVPQPTEMPAGCRFQPRCPHGTAPCVAAQVLTVPQADHRVRCIRAGELLLPGSLNEARAAE